MIRPSHQYYAMSAFGQMQVLHLQPPWGALLALHGRKRMGRFR